MKILHILLAEAKGGLELYASNLMLQQQIAGYEVFAYVLEGSEVDKMLAQNPAITRLYGAKPKRFSLTNIWRVRKILKQNKISLLHSHNRLDIWTASIANFDRFVKHIHSIYMMVTLTKKALQYRFIYGNPSAVISTSELTNKAIAEKLAVKPEKIRLVRYGMQTDIYQENELIIKEIREKYRANEKIVVGTLARITPLKGVQDLAEAYEFLPEKWKDKIVFWLIGEPSILKRNGEQIIYEQEDEILDKSIRDFIEKHHLQEKVQRIGFQKNYIDFLGAMDIFVLASHNEMYALSMIEAMLMQKAVIGTQGGGTPEQVAQEQRGLLVPIRSPKAIAEAIVRYAENPEFAKKMAENARLWALENHSWKKTLLAYQKIYEA